MISCFVCSALVLYAVNGRRGDLLVILHSSVQSLSAASPKVTAETFPRPTTAWAALPLRPVFYSKHWPVGIDQRGSLLRVALNKACTLDPANDCMPRYSEGCGLFAFNSSVPESLYEQCPNLYGFSLTNAHDERGAVPTCCRSTTVTEETVPTTASAMTVVALMSAAAGTPPGSEEEASGAVWITFVGDSTINALFGWLRHYLCEASWSGPFNCSSMPFDRAPLGQVLWPEEQRPCGLSSLIKNASRPWYYLLSEYDQTHSAFTLRQRSGPVMVFQFFSMRSILRKNGLGSPAGWPATFATDPAGYLKCASRVLHRVAEASDLLFINLGVHYNVGEEDAYAQSLDTTFSTLAKAASSPSVRLLHVLPIESVPTHFASSDGSGEFGRQSGGYAPETWGKCATATLANQSNDKTSITSMPKGFYSFLCAPITNLSAARWRNDILDEKLRSHPELASAVVKRFDRLVRRCDLHQGVNGDCLHYEWFYKAGGGKTGGYLQNATLSAVETALVGLRQWKKDHTFDA